MNRLPSKNARLVADMIKSAFHTLTSDEKKDVLTLVTASEKISLDAPTVTKTIASTGGDIGRAASVLGCARRTLQNKMREFGLPPGKPGRKTR